MRTEFDLRCTWLGLGHLVFIALVKGQSSIKILFKQFRKKKPIRNTNGQKELEKDSWRNEQKKERENAQVFN